MSHGYTWAISPGYEIFTANPDGSDLRQLTNHPGYDAEGTMSVDGKWLVFTSKRDNDVDLYKMHMDGKRPDAADEERRLRRRRVLLARRPAHRVAHVPDRGTRPRSRRSTSCSTSTSCGRRRWTCGRRRDGSHQRQVTNKPARRSRRTSRPTTARSSTLRTGGPRSRNFDLYLVAWTRRARAGDARSRVRRVPMFSPNGKWLAFCANRGGNVPSLSLMHRADPVRGMHRREAG